MLAQNSSCHIRSADSCYFCISSKCVRFHPSHSVQFKLKLYNWLKKQGQCNPAEARSWDTESLSFMSSPAASDNNFSTLPCPGWQDTSFCWQSKECRNAMCHTSAKLSHWLMGGKKKTKCWLRNLAKVNSSAFLLLSTSLSNGSW